MQSHPKKKEKKRKKEKKKNRKITHASIPTHQQFTHSMYPVAVVVLIALRWLQLLAHKHANKNHKYMFHAIYYLFIFVWESDILLRAPWFTRLDNVWVKSDDDPLIVGLLVAQMIWYTHCFFESFVMDRKRHDFLLMLAHHVLTVALVAGAHQLHFDRLALVVFVEQDITDILVNVSKLAHRFVPNKTLHTFLVVTLTVMWWLTRVCALGFITLQTTIRVVHSIEELLLLSLLAILFGMQIVWGVGLVRICRNYLVTGKLRDTFDSPELD